MRFCSRPEPACTRWIDKSAAVSINHANIYLLFYTEMWSNLQRVYWKCRIIFVWY